MSQGIPRLGATHQVPADLCGGAGSLGAIRVRLEDCQAQIDPSHRSGCVKGGLCTVWRVRRNGPCPRATLLSLSKILPGALAQQGGTISISLHPTSQGFQWICPSQFHTLGLCRVNTRGLSSSERPLHRKLKLSSTICSMCHDGSRWV